MKKKLFTLYLCVMFGTLAFCFGDTIREQRIKTLKQAGGTVLATDYDGLWLWPYCTAIVVVGGIIGLRHSKN